MAPMKNRSRAKRSKKDSVDYISELHDDLLLLILSLLSFKEAGRTTVLSTRWEPLWGVLHQVSRSLDISNTAADTSTLERLSVERLRFINFVDMITTKFQGRKLEHIRICFDLDGSLTRNIDEWFVFIFASNVRTLELDFGKHHLNEYCFPNILLSTFHFLENLILKYIMMSGEALECLLSSCPILKSLSLCGRIGDLKFSGQKLMLKYLDISLCVDRQNIEISDINLVSFCYKGFLENLVIRNVPKLEKISVTVDTLEMRFFDMLSNCQGLRSLELDMDKPYPYRQLYYIFEFPVLLGLEHLILNLDLRQVHDESFYKFTPLIKACPKLRSFALQVNWVYPFFKRRRGYVVRGLSDQPLPNLELVEIRGYYGRVTELEFVHYFLDNAANLKKLVIDPRNQKILANPTQLAGGEVRFDLDNDDLLESWEFSGNMVSDTAKAVKKARGFAKHQLQHKIRPTVQLQIL